MIFLKKLFYLLFLILSIYFLTCSEETNEVKFSVRSTNGNFTGGWYKVNGGITATFEGVEIDYNVYEFESTIEDLDYLEVGASKTDSSQSLEIKIYVDDIKVKSSSIEPYETITSSGDYKYDLELDYEYGEEEDTTDTNTTE